MTKHQEDQLTMWTATDAVLRAHEAQWQSIVAFANAVALFRQIREAVSPEASTQQQDNTGITLAKTVLKENLIEQCKQMALNIKSYAVNIQDFGLQKQFDFTPTYFERLRDNTVSVVANTIFEKGNMLRKALADYGTGKEELEALQLTLTKYKDMNAAPRLAKGAVKQATVNISDKMSEGSLQLSQMDNLVGNFNKKYPEFVSAFRNARIVINMSSSKKSKKLPPAGDVK